MARGASRGRRRRPPRSLPRRHRTTAARDPPHGRDPGRDHPGRLHAADAVARRATTSTARPATWCCCCPPTFAAFFVLTVVSSVASGGGRELLNRDQGVAFPVSPTTDHLGALLMAPLNIAWLLQSWALLGSAAYALPLDAVAPAQVVILLWLAAATSDRTDRGVDDGGDPSPAPRPLGRARRSCSPSGPLAAVLQVRGSSHRVPRPAAHRCGRRPRDRAASGPTG